MTPIWRESGSKRWAKILRKKRIAQLERPKYKIGNEEISLAGPTPKRVEGFLKFYGKAKLSELFLPSTDKIDEASREFGKLAVDATGNSKSAATILNICLEKEVSEEQAADLPVQTIAQVNLDFFLTLILTYFTQVK